MESLLYASAFYLLPGIRLDGLHPLLCQGCCHARPASPPLRYPVPALLRPVGLACLLLQFKLALSTLLFNGQTFLMVMPPARSQILLKCWETPLPPLLPHPILACPIILAMPGSSVPSTSSICGSARWQVADGQTRTTLVASQLQQSACDCARTAL